MTDTDKPKLTIVKNKTHRKLVKRAKKAIDGVEHKPRPGSGRPALRQEIIDWEPTDEDRQKVRLLISAKKTPEDIGKIICPFGVISGSTVRRRFKEEIKKGKLELELRVAEVAYEMAVSGKAPLMTQFWLRCAGWKEREPSQTNVKEDSGSETIANKMQKAAKYMIETLPNPNKVENSG